MHGCNTHKKTSSVFQLCRAKTKNTFSGTNLHEIEAVWNTRITTTPVLKLSFWHAVDHTVDFTQSVMCIYPSLFQWNSLPFGKHGYHSQSPAFCWIVFPPRKVAANGIPESRWTEDCIVILMPRAWKRFRQAILIIELINRLLIIQSINWLIDQSINQSTC